LLLTLTKNTIRQWHWSTTTTHWLDSYPYVKNRQTTGLVKWVSYQILDKEIDQSLQNTLRSLLHWFFLHVFVSPARHFWKKLQF